MRRVNADKIVGAEIGVSIGQMSECLLTHRGVTLYMIDPWAAEEDQPKAYLESGDGHAHFTSSEQQAHYETAVRVTEFAGDRRTVIRKPSVEAAKEIKDDALDFVFIDGDHSYEGCKADIIAWTPKVKDGGIVGGHDYAYEHLPGVQKAVDEMVKKNKWKLERGENYTWFCRK